MVQPVPNDKKTNGSRACGHLDFKDVSRVLATLEQEADLPPGRFRNKVIRAIKEKHGYRDNKARMVTGSWKMLLMIAFPLYSGFRRSEVVSLMWSDVMFVNHKGEVVVRPEVSILEQKVRRKKRNRSVPITEDLAYYIMKYYMECKPTNLNTWIFPSIFKACEGKHITTKGMYEIISKTFARFGIYDRDGWVAPHTLRKTYGRHLWKLLGENFEALVKVNKIFGHYSIDDTIRYLGIFTDEKQKVHESLSFRRQTA